MEKEVRRHLKSFIHNIDILIVEDDGVFRTHFDIFCKNDHEVKRVLKKHQRFAFYNHSFSCYPKNEWLIFELHRTTYSNDSLQIIAIFDLLKNSYRIPYKYVTSQKNEPNPRQVTLLRSLVLIL